MKRSTVLALLLGLVVTLGVAGLDLLGAFTPAERLSIDFRFAGLPRRPEPMSDAIAHVDIDDAALELIERWPWPRSRLADVVDEIRLAGARTIAIDILLSEPSSPEEDGRLADALERTSCVLPLDVHHGETHDPVWSEPGAEHELDRLLDALGRDIRLDVRTALDEADVTGPRRARYRSMPIQFKQAAAWRALQERTDGPETFEEFERRLTPGLGAMTGRYAERRILLQAWRQAEAWRLARGALLPGPGRGTYKDEAPLPEFVAAAAAVGFVSINRQAHRDGVVREIEATLPAPGGRALQFGLAAAAQYRGLSPSAVTVTDDRFVLGHVELPLRDGRLWIWWPTSTTAPPERWRGLLAGGGDDEVETPGHVPIRELVELAESRRIIARNRAELDVYTRRILARAGAPVAEGAALTDAERAAAADEVSFSLEGLADDVPLEDLDPGVRDHVHDCRIWRALDVAVREDAAMNDRVSTTIRERLDGKLVFVGWTATGTAADFVPTPVDPKTPGVVVHAAIANMALTGRFVRFLPAGPARGLVLLVGLLCTLAAVRFSTLPSAITAGLIGAAFAFTGGYWLFTRHDLIVPMVAPLTAGGSAWVACTALQAALAQRERQRVTRQFKSRVSAQLVDHLSAHPDALTVTGAERELTVMFADLAGFTTISESLGGARTVSTLNHYMTALTEILIDEDAYVNKFLGDGFMAFWSAFAPDEGQAMKACRAALRCQAVVHELNGDPELDGIPEIGLRIGVATGHVVVGDCGAPPALNDYTVIGDAVNLASRLESANKQFGTRVLINGRTRELVTDHDGPPLRPIGRVAVVGQSAPSEIFEIVPEGTPGEIIEISARIVESYAAARFDDVAGALAELEKHGDTTKLAEIYREAMDEVADGFDGVIRLHLK